MVKIRLAKQGKRNDHFFRIVAIDSQKKNNGEAIEILGFWNPREDKKSINKNGIMAWIEKGAQVSPTVSKLIS